MEIDEIRAFIAVADAGSVNAGARKMHLTQPTVSRQVQRLEASLDAKLLDRRTKPLSLTATGQVVLEHCRHVLRSLEDLQHSMAVGEGPTGELRIGFSQALSDFTLAKPVDQLRRAFPRVMLSIKTGWSDGLMDDVRSGRLDAAFVFLPDDASPPAGLEGQKIGTESLVVVSSRRSRVPGTLALKDLADAIWVLKPQGCVIRATLQRALQSVNGALHVAVEVYETDLKLSLVARGVGLSLIPSRVLARSQLRPRLRAIRIRGQALKLGVWIVYVRPPERLLPVLAMLREARAAVYATHSVRG